MKKTIINIELSPWTMFIFNHKENIFVFIQNPDNISTFKTIGKKDKIDFSRCSKLNKILLLQILN